MMPHDACERSAMPCPPVCWTLPGAFPLQGIRRRAATASDHTRPHRPTATPGLPPTRRRRMHTSSAGPMPKHRRDAAPPTPPKRRRPHCAVHHHRSGMDPQRTHGCPRMHIRRAAHTDKRRARARQGGAFGVWCASTENLPKRDPHRPLGDCSEAATEPANFRAFLHRRDRCTTRCCHLAMLVPSMGFRPLRGSQVTAAVGWTDDAIPRPVAAEPNPKKRHVARERLSGGWVRRTRGCDGPPWGL